MRLVITKMNLGLWAAAYVRQKINAASPVPDKPFVLGLPTGGTVIDMYANLRQFNKTGELSFKNVVTFNMDEYVGLPEDHPQSYHSYMNVNLFDAVDINRQNVHILNGNAPDLTRECAAYEAAVSAAGGVDLFLGGVGRNGHLAFNEPGSAFDTRTRPVSLTPSTIEANARFFLNDPARVPARALTVGIGTVTDAKEVLILASGEKKAQAVKQLLEHEPTAEWPVTALKTHPHATLLADLSACSLLSPQNQAKIRALTQAAPDAEHWTLEF